MQNPDANLSQQYSEMTLSGQFQACLFIYLFFYEKILRAQKHSRANINQQKKN